MSRVLVVFALLAALGLGFAAGTGGLKLHFGGKPAVLVDGEFILGAEGVQVAFTIEEPRHVGIYVALPEGTKADVTLARLLPAMRPDLIYVQEDTTRHAMEGPDGVSWADLKHAGAYVLRVPPIPTAMGQMAPKVRVRVTVP